MSNHEPPIELTGSQAVFLIHADEPTRQRVRAMAEAMEVELEVYDNAEAFLSSFSASRSGCVVTEMRLLGMNGLELQQRLVALGSSIPVIFLTAFPETRLVVRGMQQGAMTVLEHQCSDHELWDTIRKALATDQQRQSRDRERAEVRARLSRLTPRQRDVLDLVLSGAGNKEIANRLGVSVRTVETCRHEIFQKTGAQSVVGLVRMVLQEKLDKA